MKLKIVKISQALIHILLGDTGQNGEKKSEKRE
jgi:hypothetical protein